MNDDSVDDAPLDEIVHAAISAALNPEGNAYITRWVLAVERFDADGKAVAMLCAPDMQSWEVIGMAEMASELARLQIHSEAVDEMYALEDDDEDD